MERLDKFISSQLPGVSRSEAKALIRRGEVLVGGVPAKSGDMKIDPEGDDVLVSGHKICYKKYLYIMLNKPAGIVCATRDGISETVLQLLPEALRRPGLFPAGRLDKDTVGFVLITDDGALAHKILAPKSHVKKKYFVCLRDEISPETAEIFRSGMTLGGEKLLPAELIKLGDRECHLILKEGKYHQIKRMFEALGNEVTYLKRVEIASIILDPKLPEGGCRELSEDELKLLESC